MDDDASFTMRLLDELTAPSREMKEAVGLVEEALGDVGDAAGEAGAAFRDATKDIDRATASMNRLDEAMAHQSWVKMKRGQAEAGKLSHEFQKMDDAMAHQRWVGLKRAEVQSQKAAFAAKQHADGLKRVEALGTPLDQMAKGPLLGIAKAGAVAAVAVGAVATVVVAKFGAAAVHMTGFAQKSILSLTQLTGSAATAAFEFDEVRKMSGRFGLDVEETQKSFQKLLAAQFSVSMAKDLIKMGADLQVVTGEAESAQRALLTLSQIKSKGKLQGEELMQLQEAGVSQGLILDALEHALGKDRDQVQKMLSGGKIDAATGVAAIIEAIKHKVGEKELGEAGAKFADTTLAGFQGRMKAGLQNAMINIGTRIEPGIVRITQLIQGSIDRLAKSGKLEALGDALVRGFDRFTGFIETNWPAIESAIGTTIDLIIGGVNMAVAALMFMSDNWSTIKTILLGVAAVAGILLAGVALLFLPFMLVTTAILGVVSALVFAIGWIASNAGSLFTAAKDWAGNLISGLIQGFSDFAAAALTKVREFGASIVETFKSAMGISSPAEVMKPPGADTVEGVGVGIEQATPDLLSDVRGLAGGVTDTFAGAIADAAPANDVIASAKAQAPMAMAAGSDISETPMQGVTAEGAAAAARSVQPGTEPSEGGGISAGGITVQVFVDGAAAGDNPEQLGSTIGAAVRRELEAIFEKAS